MIRRIRVALSERAFVHDRERPIRYLTPGVHWVLGSRREIVWVKTETLLAKLCTEQLELVPAEDLRVVRLAEHERAIVSLRGRPVRWLGVGEHQVWTVEKSVLREADGTLRVEPAVEVEVLDVSPVTAEPLDADRRALAPASDYVEETVAEGAVALRYVDGVLDEVLGPGRQAAWKVSKQVHLAVVDLRERLLSITGQEVMTKDRVSLRMNLTVAFRVADPKRMATVAREPDDVLYLAVQLAAREAVSVRTLDELLASRDVLSGALADEVKRRAGAVGLAVMSLALKDVVLPGDMKALLNRVIEAQKEAEAGVILRREEAAATRSMAQTAKVLADNPVLLKLKELEAWGQLAKQVGGVHVVLGEGAVPSLRIEAP